MEHTSSKGYKFLHTKESIVYETNIYVDPSVMQRTVYTPIKVTEPTKPFKTMPGGGGHPAAMGMGAAAHFVGLPEDEITSMLGGNAAEFYGLDLEKLAPIVARIGPEKASFQQ